MVVLVEHSRRNVIGILGGQAKAMVVTSSRMEALNWSRRLDTYIASKGYDDMSTLVALSGTLKDESARTSPRSR